LLPVQNPHICISEAGCKHPSWVRPLDA
jgi:hypothetical protein